MSRVNPILLLLFCSLIAQRVCAQDSLIVIGHIQETFFKRGMKDCHLQIFTADSIEVETYRTENIQIHNDSSLFNIYTVASPGNYLLRASKGGVCRCVATFLCACGREGGKRATSCSNAPEFACATVGRGRDSSHTY